MPESICPFCKSTKLFVTTPYIELARSGKYENKMTYCCKSQRQNADYLKKHFGENAPVEVDEVSKL